VYASATIRKIRVVVDAVLAELDPIFDEMYATGGRRSVPPEQLLKATVLMAMYSIRSERAFCERLNYDLLFKWFLDMRIDQPAFDATTFSKNRERSARARSRRRVLRSRRAAREAASLRVLGAFLRRRHLVEGVGITQVVQAEGRTAVGAAGGRNAEVQWHGEKRKNDTHASTTLAFGTPALVAQGIEHRPPEPCAQVRILPRAPLVFRPDQGK
jgi:hypothetical protein